jgi:hypothetical protein
MVTAVALLRGRSPHDLELVDLTTDSATARVVAQKLLRELPCGQDPVLDALDRGRRRALQLIAGETREVV